MCNQSDTYSVKNTAKEVRMPLQEEFESQGVWLFRWRSYLPLLLLVLLVYPMLNFRYLGNCEFYDHIWEALCILIGMLGLGIRAYTIGHTPAHTSGRNTKKQVAEQLNTKGIYSIVRHPLYLGNYFMMLGVVMFAHSVWAIAIFSLLYWVYYERIMYAEEQFLRGKFGTVYTDWAAHTPAFIPSFKHFKRPEYDFSVKKVIKKEKNGLLAIFVLLFVFHNLGYSIENSQIKLDIDWIFICTVVSLVLYLILKVLKHNTKLFDETGR